MAGSVHGDARRARRLDRLAVIPRRTPIARATRPRAVLAIAIGDADARPAVGGLLARAAHVARRLLLRPARGPDEAVVGAGVCVAALLVDLGDARERLFDEPRPRVDARVDVVRVRPFARRAAARDDADDLARA